MTKLVNQYEIMLYKKQATYKGGCLLVSFIHQIKACQRKIVILINMWHC